MAIHGMLVRDDLKWIRFIRDETDSMVRVLLHEKLYDRLRPVCEYYNKIEPGVSVSAPPYIKECLDWLFDLTLELDIFEWTVSIALVPLFFERITSSISLGKFTYKAIGKSGSFKSGGCPSGGGTKILELPVEG
ncbi:hypothetical protein [Halostagnicola larsenii]|uniref:hypothetical protein n=1 Tax=Halostagnicola larsenii TaxID=353800 RepID=UPI0012F7FE1A|nr:hypothetical protein [Halostagnicola larsenii]